MTKFTGLTASLTSTWPGHQASICINGDTTRGKICHGRNGSGDTMTITLPKKSIVKNIKIYNRIGQQRRMVGAIIKAGDTLVTTIREAKDIYEIRVPDVLTNKVSIKTNTWFNLREVEIYGDRVGGIN